jgi:post-segregation antitoxin (ccd killing protein)
MPKVSVYLPDDLYREAKARNLSLSTLTQRAVEEALAASDKQRWVERMRARPPLGVGVLDTRGVMDEVRAELEG